jgi:hypothetical protein
MLFFKLAEILPTFNLIKFKQKKNLDIPSLIKSLHKCMKIYTGRKKKHTHNELIKKMVRNQLHIHKDRSLRAAKKKERNKSNEGETRIKSFFFLFISKVYLSSCLRGDEVIIKCVN